MATKTPVSETQKMTIIFPKALLQRLRGCVPPRQISAFVVDAVEEKLALQEQSAAIEEAAGCWSDADHPELQTDEDIDRWLVELRQSWDVHLADVGIVYDAKS